MRPEADKWRVDQHYESALLAALDQIRRRHDRRQQMRDLIHQGMACLIIVLLGIASWYWLQSIEVHLKRADRQDALPAGMTRIGNGEPRPALRGSSM